MPYKKPDPFTKRVMNPLIMLLAKLGLNLWGACVLTVPGRKTGKPQHVPVNPLPFEGERYLVAPRGETQWVRNIRAAGGGELRRGRRSERFRVVELVDEEKPPLLRAYLKLWAWETGQFFHGVKHDAPDDAVRAEAALHPMFLIVPE